MDEKSVQPTRSQDEFSREALGSTSWASFYFRACRKEILQTHAFDIIINDAMC